jgi:hypothetical protein
MGMKGNACPISGRAQPMSETAEDDLAARLLYESYFYVKIFT